jgi:uncharacterized membrane protein
LNKQSIGLALIVISVVIGIIAIGFDGLPDEAIMPFLAISVVGLGAGIVLRNYKAKHSKRDKSKFKRTNTKSWDT